MGKIAAALRRVATPVLVLTLLGCAGADEGRLDTAAESVLTANALTANALTANALTANALTANALTANALDPAALSAIEDPGPSGALARMLLRYEVSCAFRADQHFDFTWVDGSGEAHEESYPGQLALAPYWAKGRLDVAGRGWVSACLAARVNAVGVSVPLSVRGTHPALAVTWSEALAYPLREGAFFGDLFGATPTAYACFDPTMTTLSDFAHRLCAQPQLLTLPVGTAYACGPIVVVGPCLSILGLLSIGPCAQENEEWRYFYGCADPGARSKIPALTTFLQLPGLL